MVINAYIMPITKYWNEKYSQWSFTQFKPKEQHLKNENKLSLKNSTGFIVNIRICIPRFFFWRKPKNEGDLGLNNPMF